MKKFIVTLILGMFTMASFAQDVIVKKDGSTILSKVTEVSDTQVKYKKHKNLNGPTYTVNVSELQCINYENGEKDTFASTQKVETPSVPVVETNTPVVATAKEVSGERAVSDAELLRMYKGSVNYDKKIKKGKNLRLWGTVASLAVATIGLIELQDYEFNIDSYPEYLVIFAAGMVAAPICYFVGDGMVKRAQKQKFYSLYQYNIPLGKNASLTADIDVLRDEIKHQQSLGLGFHLNF